MTPKPDNLHDKVRSKMVAEINHDELTIRLLEIAIGLKRPEGQSAATEMRRFEDQARRGEIPAYIVRDFKQMATAAIEYLAECINKMDRVQ